MQAVVSAFEFDDLVAARGRARETNRVHSGFGSRRSKAAHLNGKTFADFLCQLPLHVVWHAEHGTGAQPLFDRFHDCRMTMPCHQRAKAEVVVYVFVAVEVPETSALPFLHKNRIGIISTIIT